MSRKYLFALTLSTFVLVAGAALAQQVRGILHKEMTPAKGTYAAPAGTLGQTTTAPWSATTIEAAVDHLPLPGRAMTVVGEIIDYSCYLQVGKHGEKHRDCGQKCLRSGQPIGLLDENGRIYLLMEEEHHPRRDGQTDLRSAAIENMGNVVTVNGTASTVSGQRALYVSGFVKGQPGSK
jgi:hypothetical protein